MDKKVPREKAIIEKRLKYERAMSIAHRFLKLIQPHILKAEIAGSVRRQCKEVGDIEIVCVEDPLNGLDNIFHKGYPGMVINGPRLKRFKYLEQGVQMELYITSEHDFGRILAIRTGSSAYSHIKLATTWNRNGWCGTSDGLRRKKECEKKGNIWKLKPEHAGKPTYPPPFYTEADFFEFLGIRWIPPVERNWQSKYDKLNYSM